MAKTYDIEVPSIVETQCTGVALTVHDTIRGVQWTLVCDSGARPLTVRRNGTPYPTLPNVLLPMRRFARRFLNVKES